MDNSALPPPHISPAALWLTLRCPKGLFQPPKQPPSPFAHSKAPQMILPCPKTLHWPTQDGQHSPSIAPNTTRSPLVTPQDVTNCSPPPPKILHRSTRDGQHRSSITPGTPGGPLVTPRCPKRLFRLPKQHRTLWSPHNAPLKYLTGHPKTPRTVLLSPKTLLRSPQDAPCGTSTPTPLTVTLKHLPYPSEPPNRPTSPSHTHPFIPHGGTPRHIHRPPPPTPPAPPCALISPLLPAL